MGIPTFKASKQGQIKIKQAREQKGWAVKEEDYTPLKEASKFLIEQHAAANGWHVNDSRWLQNFEQLFRVEKHRTIHEIGTIIASSQQGSLLERIEQLIETGEVFAKDISYGTWSRFAAQKKVKAIKARAFKAYCQVLGLNWQEIADRAEPQEFEDSAGGLTKVLESWQVGNLESTGQPVTRPTCHPTLSFENSYSLDATRERLALPGALVRTYSANANVEGQFLRRTNVQIQTHALQLKQTSYFFGERSANGGGEAGSDASQTRSLRTPVTRPYHNLPARYHTALIGREKEISWLLERLSCDARVCRISVEGIGGAGKTALVLEAAYHCLEASCRVKTTPSALSFDAIIFTSAKQQHLMGHGLLQRHKQDRTLHDIFRVIFRTLECLGVMPADFDKQLECIQTSLAHLHTLLIVDNLETIEDQDGVLSFLSELPPTVKVVITTRTRGTFGIPLHLECLPLDEGLCLIQHQAHEQSVQLKPEQFQAIYQRTSGLPLGIVYVIGQLSVYGISVDVLTTRLSQANSDLAQYCFEDSVQRLRGQPAHRLLMVLALFAKSASQNAIAQIALPEAESFNALAQLYRLRLVMQHEERYDMHPLTREYALAELKTYSEFEQQVRERWVNWYLRFSQVYRQQDWKQWHEYKDLDKEWENLQAVIDWCIHQKRYEQVKQFWQDVKGYTYVHGYWHERLAWIDWLLQAAEQRQDKSMMAEALVDKGWTLTLMVMGKPEQLAEVDALFTQVSNLQDGEDLIFQLDLKINWAVLSIHQRNFEQAQQLLNQGKELLERVQIEEKTRLRQQIRLNYYEAEVWFRTGNYEQAKMVYQKALEQAQVAQWQQVQVYIVNWLAEVALFGEGNLDEAERLLKTSMPIALASKDKRSITVHKRSWAHLEKMKGNLCEFQRWAKEAKEGFESLGMLAEAQEMQSWLESL